MSEQQSRTIEQEDTSMTVAEAGRRGGISRRDTAPPGAYEEMGRRGGAATKAKHGSEHYSRIGRMGAESLKRSNVDFAALSQRALAAKRKKWGAREAKD